MVFQEMLVNLKINSNNNKTSDVFKKSFESEYN